LRRAFVVYFCIALLAGCGFHLRGQAELPYSTLHVSGSGSSTLISSLKRVLRSGNVRLVDKADDAQVKLIILSDVKEKSILSLSGAGRAQEYELRQRVTFRIVTAAEPDSPPGVIVSQRTISFNDALVLAKESEETLLYRDMENDVVQQMLRRLAAAK
jgi:LPS-assembly lipoprotein